MTLTPLPYLRADSRSAAPSADLSTDERRLSDLPLTVLVGVTGVGKSTALSALAGTTGRVLPDRREITDAVMILPLAGTPVTDREERFRLTAQYRTQHPGGMAQALGSLVVDTAYWGSALVFDGLRGLDEVRYAAETYPSWRFVALGAPDSVRVGRLLGRGDTFDQITVGQIAGDHSAGDQVSGSNSADLHTGLRTALLDIRGVQDVFSEAELNKLTQLTAAGHTPQDIAAKVKIVVSERRNYDPQAAEAYLRTLPPERALILDTVALNPEQVAAAVLEWAGEVKA
ncbi:ATPase [Deinococcus sp.]|uniref:ATPase n=1 Tax=Deinococcus sp. TaxID=47478 RepID=UPI0025C063BF|nr:ATPase [Deinococcus sp.]